MLFHDRKLKAGTAAAVAASVLWMTSGGNAWAELQCARRDPASEPLALQRPRAFSIPARVHCKNNDKQAKQSRHHTPQRVTITTT